MKNGKTSIKLPFLAYLITYFVNRARHSRRQKCDLPYLLVCFLVHIFHKPADIWGNPKSGKVPEEKNNGRLYYKHCNARVKSPVLV